MFMNTFSGKKIANFNMKWAIVWAQSLIEEIKTDNPLIHTPLEIDQFIEQNIEDAQKIFDADKGGDCAIEDLVKVFEQIKLLADRAKNDGAISCSLTFNFFEFQHNQAIELLDYYGEPVRMFSSDCDPWTPSPRIPYSNIFTNSGKVLSDTEEGSLLILSPCKVSDKECKVGDEDNILSYYFLSLTYRPVNQAIQHSGTTPAQISFEDFKAHIKQLGVEHWLMTGFFTEKEKAQLCAEKNIQYRPVNQAIQHSGTRPAFISFKDFKAHITQFGVEHLLTTGFFSEKEQAQLVKYAEKNIQDLDAISSVLEDPSVAQLSRAMGFAISSVLERS